MQFSGTGARVGKEEGKSVYVLYIWGGMYEVVATPAVICLSCLWIL